jgi:hypothetical protein
MILVLATACNARKQITVLARTTQAHGTRVDAVVTSLSRASSAIPVLVRSRIVLTRQVFETIPGTQGVPSTILNPDQLLSPSNVIATSQVVRATDRG